MSSTTKVRIGMTMARELEIEVVESDVVAEFEMAVASGAPVWWLTDRKGLRRGIVVERIAFIEVESAEDRPGVGFSHSETS